MTMLAPLEADWLTLAPGFAAYRVLPPGGRGPGLLLCQEIFGVNAHIRRVAEQYALAGYVVLAPDLFWRSAPRVELGYEGEDRQRAFALMQAYDTDAAIADLQMAMAALRGLPQTAHARSGAIGYCMGGRMAYLAAAEAGADAAVAYYGGGIQAQLQRASQITCAVQLHYAGHDDHIPPEAVDAVTSALGKRAEVHVYDGAEHGFNCWARASFHAPSAALAHARTLAFLAGKLW
jgi:carboxymethylenebutenolidase